MPYGADSDVVPVQKFRDVQKLYAAMTDGKMEGILYGAQNQAEIHYAMAVKNNLYEALEYARQVEEAAKSHRQEMRRKREQGEEVVGEGRKTPSTGEFLSGFWREDRRIAKIEALINSEEMPVKTYEEQLCEEWFKDKVTAIANTRKTEHQVQNGQRDIAIDYSRIRTKMVLKNENDVQLVVPDICLKVNGRTVPARLQKAGSRTF